MRLVGFLVATLSFISGCASSNVPERFMPQFPQKPVISTVEVGPSINPVTIEEIFDEINPRSASAKAFISNFVPVFDAIWTKSCREPRAACIFLKNFVTVVQDGVEAVVMIEVGPGDFVSVSYANIVDETPVMAARRTAEETVRALHSR